MITINTENLKRKGSVVLACAVISSMAIVPIANAAQEAKDSEHTKISAEAGMRKRGNKRKREKDFKKALSNLTEEEKAALKSKHDEMKDKFDSLSDEEKEAVRAEREADLKKDER